MNPYKYYSENKLNDPSNAMVLHCTKQGEVGKYCRYFCFIAYTPNVRPIQLHLFGFTALIVDESIDDLEEIMLQDIFKVFNKYYKNTTTLYTDQFFSYLRALSTPGFTWTYDENYENLQIDPEELTVPFEIKLIALERTLLADLEDYLIELCEKDFEV